MRDSFESLIYDELYDKVSENTPDICCKDEIVEGHIHKIAELIAKEYWKGLEEKEELCR